VVTQPIPSEKPATKARILETAACVGFLTTAQNAVIGPIHPKAMPVILTTDEERAMWTRAMG
jgi:putative SOS response-associated peptidase YedK